MSIPADTGHGPVEAPPDEGGVVSEHITDGQLMLGLVVDADGLVLEVDILGGLDPRDARLLRFLHVK